uniref:D-alanine--poly(phosphoribitol) ligase subunit DltA n=1 Tax=Methanobrevibacter sp. TaxID=66852 RepID=UPI00388D0776
MGGHEIKFSFECHLNSFNDLDMKFDKIAKSINIQFDNNFNHYTCENKKIYEFKDVSNQNPSDIKKEMDSFFAYSFDNFVDVSLFKFLVLKVKDKFIILANIHSLIFDYSLIDNFYKFFSDIKEIHFDAIHHYDYLEEYLFGPDYKKDLNFWKNYLSDSLPNVKYYNVKSDNYSSKRIKLPDFSTENDISKFNFITAIFSLYLSRIDNTKGCLFKTSVSDKYFGYSSLLNVDLEDISFSSHLDNVCMNYEDISRHTMLDVENYIDAASYYSIFDFSSLDDVSIRNGEGSAITINVFSHSLELLYNDDLFSDVYIDHMLSNIEFLMNNVLESQNLLCKDIDILSDMDKSLISEFSKGKSLDVDENKSLSHSFRNHALKFPENIAIDDGVNKITYGELERSSNSIAYTLRNEYNIFPNTSVALFLPRNYHFPQIVLAINKIGAAFVPIDLDYPEKRINHMLDISQSTHIITTRELSHLHDFNAEIIYIDDLGSDCNEPVDILAKSNALFAIMFTSGTTGLPKGVKISNKQISGIAIAYKDIFNCESDDVIGCYASFSFVASFGLYWALYLGLGCRIFNENERKDTLLLLDVLKNIPMCELTLPTAVGYPIFEDNDINLKHMVLAGSKLNELSMSSNKTKLVNIYGTTEIIFAISNVYDLNDLDDKIPIGRPVANTWTYILDENNMQVPIGVPGEICISSSYISSGYVNNDWLNSKSFVDNPFCEGKSNQRMYRTGDLGYYDFDGNINIIGRLDDQLSVRGFRVESSEILNIINRFDSIDDVFLDVEKDNLVLYYTVEGDFKSDTLKKALEDELPYYMLPSIYIELDEIPLNINGKIDKSALKEHISKDYVEKYEDDVLNHVIRSFKKVLSTDFILFDDDFVSLGGNSLSAMELQRVLNDEMDVNIASNKLMELSTPSNIANHIKFDLNIYSSPQIKYDFSGICPLSESQLNVYLDEQVKDMGTSYNNPFKIKFKDSYSADKIYDSILKLFDVLPILKSRVVIENEIPSLKFDAEPEIIKGSKSDVGSFVRKFELDKYLSRFLIVENDNESVFLCMDFNHLIFDGTSLNIILSRFLKILDASDDFDIDDGILRQISFEESILSSSMDEAEKFFDKLLADSDDAHELLASVKTDDLVENEYWDELIIDNKYLNSFLSEYKITLNHFLTSAFAYTLSRFTGSSKVLFNLVENGRNHIDLSDSVGMFVRTLPLLLDCKNQSIKSFLDYSNELITSAMKYDFYPYRDLVNKYNLNSSVFFQYSHDIFLNSQKNLFTEELSHDRVGDLSFYVFNLENGNFGIRAFFSDKFSKTTIESFICSFKSIFQELLNKKQLCEINYISNNDLAVLDKINLTEHDLNYNDILEAFNDKLSKNPDNKLVSYKNNSYTYSEGAFIADKIAKSLKNLDVELGDNVSFLVERSELYLLSVLGILSAGAVYVPLDDAHPDERIDFILKDTQSKVVIASDETHERVKGLSYNGIVLNISDIVKKEISELTKLNVNSSDLACILYTSGTTGIPKGVKITRKSVLNMVSFYRDKYFLSDKDVYGMYSKIGFDAALLAISNVLYSGACLTVVPEDIRFNMKKLNEYFIKHNVTHTLINTQVAKLFIRDTDNTSLKVLSVGGEKLGAIENPNAYSLIDKFGPTEACVFISSINNADKIDSSSIGFLNYNTKVYILDQESRRVPIGAVGELCIAGNQIADGYLNRDDETEKSFIANPFDESEDYNIIYRTGDMVRLLPDESLAIIGRRDGQVKIRGNRVELLEVDSVIRELDYIDDVTVQTIKKDTNNELVAYVVLKDEIDDDTLQNKIRDHVARYKPDYMVPSYVIKLDAIPLNVNGKVNKSALPEIDFASLQTEYVAPTTQSEKYVVEAFEKVFNQKIGLHDDFIRLGGDSLSAIKLLSYLEDYNVTAADVLKLRTPYAIANSIDNNLQFELNSYSLDEGCPLNEPQLNVYLDIISNNKVDSYIIPLEITISDKYSSQDIVEALDKLLNAHPILGMCVDNSFEVPYLVKGLKPQIILYENDRDFINEFLTKAFDLEKSLCRFLITENGNCHSLFAAFNHIIFDAISANVFKNNLFTLLDGGSVDVDESFLEVSDFTRQIANTPNYIEAKQFYENMLADSREIPSLLECVVDDGLGMIHFNLDVDLNLLYSFLDKYSISENVLFTSAFAYTLSRYIGSEKVLFNIVENGRDRFNNFDAVGMYVNTLPLLVNCKNQDISSFIDNMSILMYDAMKYNYYPFRLLANEFNIDFNIIFQYKPDWISDINSSDEIYQDIDLITDFAADVSQKDGGYELNIQYSNKYSQDMIKSFAESFNLILSQMIHVNDLCEINYITNDDLELLNQFNHNDHDLAYDDIMDAFNANLTKFSSNALVSYMDKSYSYAESAFISNEISESLKNSGVNVGDNVSFLVERSELYMFCVLGIMSAGAVYVPLDDNLPDERMEFILNDTESKVIITSDETYERVRDLSYDAVILNLSDILEGKIGELSYLPVDYCDLACILYTSGTTGVPKGVKVTRKSVLNVCEFFASKYAFDSNEVYGLFSTIGFDAGSLAIGQVIYSGACLSVIPQDIKLDMDKLNQYYIKHNITYTMMTTQVAKLFMQNVDETSLKVLLVGGETLGDFKNKGNYILVDGFGPTEAFSFISSIENSHKINSSSVGHLNYNTKVYILDDEYRRVPIGAVGELYLSGSQIAQGYLNREEETEASFINNPFDDNDDYGLLYRTGDMVRMLPDATLGIVGRRDSQVKIRGNRVELSEVEAVIRDLDYVDDVTVQTVKNGTNEELVAYVVLNEKMDDNSIKESIGSYIGEYKPDYMIPSFVIRLDSIPLTVNAKVDKHALPDVDLDVLRAGYVAPSNKTEKEIVNAFEKVFNQENIGIYDDFISFGGDSLAAIKVLTFLKDYNISAADILSLRTPHAIANNIIDISLDFDTYSIDSGCPLNEPQLNVYLDIVANEKEDSYHIPLSMKISKNYSSQSIINALNEMLDVHPILGMCVSDEFEVPYLVKGLKPQITVKSDVDDGFITEFLTKSFDLHDNLCRFLLVESDDEFNLLAVFNHIIFDGSSDSVFKRDLENILCGEFIDVDDSFLKVSAFNQQIQNSDDYFEAEEFFDSLLADSDEVGILLDSALSDNSGHLTTCLDLNHGLFNSFLEKYNVNENILFNAVFAYTLSRFVGSEKVLFNIAENGRDRFGNFDSIGMFVNTLPLLVDCKNQDISSFLEYMSDRVYGVMMNNFYPFRLLASKYDINSDILFQFMPEWVKNSNDDDEDVNTDLLNNIGNLIADFIVEVIQKGNNYNLSITHSSKYSNDFIKRFAESFKIILHEILNVDKLSEINYISDSDIALLDSYNDTEHSLIYEDILDAFNDNLSSNPESTLVSYMDVSYSYGECAFIA